MPPFVQILQFIVGIDPLMDRLVRIIKMLLHQFGIFISPSRL